VKIIDEVPSALVGLVVKLDITGVYETPDPGPSPGRPTTVPVVQWIGRSPPKAEICWFDSSRARRGVAKPSIAPRSGRGDRGSRAHHPDQGIAQPSRAPALGAGGAGAKPATLTVACIEPTWYPRPMNPKREMVRWLRRKGRSYAEISKQLGVAKSSIHHMVQGIVLNGLRLCRIDAQACFGSHATINPTGYAELVANVGAGSTRNRTLPHARKPDKAAQEP
jgi:hypothetical protein